MAEIPTYKRLRDMPRELADDVREGVRKLGDRSLPGQPSYDTITKRVNASFTSSKWEVALSRDTVRDILRRSRARTKENRTNEERELTPDEEAAETHKDQQIFALTEERNLLRRQVRTATQEQTALSAMEKGIEVVSREAALLLPNFEPANIIVRDPKDHVEEAVLFCSCWHYGEVVSERETTGFGKYDIPICQASIQVMTDAVLGLIRDHHRGLNIRKLWVVEVGDSVSGIIHDELKVTNERPIATQVVGSGLLRALSLRDLAANIKEVEHIGIVGNHGRTTRRPAHKEKAEDSFDRMSYEYTSLLASKIPNLKTTIAPSPKYLAEINGHRFLFEHGDSIRMWMGFPYYGAAREQAKLLSSFVNAKNLLANNQQLAEYMSKGFRYFCQPPTETVLCGGTPCEIGKLKAGGSVLGADGDDHEIVGVSSRHYAGTLVCLTPDHLPPVRLTADHPLLVKRGPYGDPLWLSAGSLSREHFVWSPTPSRLVCSAGSQWPYSPFLLGLWLAEGSVDGERKSHYTLSANEGHLAEKICSEIEALRYDLPQYGRIDVVITGRDFVEVASAFGRGAAHKRLPESYLGLTDDFLWEVLRGWVAGDGHYRTRRGVYAECTAATVSRDLVWQMWSIARRCGLNPSLKERPPKDNHQRAFVLTFSGDDAVALYQGTAPGCVSSAAGRWLHLKRVEREHYDGPVVNMKAAGSYVAGGVAVSNCFGNFHTSLVADGPNGSELIATGSPKGVDEYSWDFLSTGSLPSQQFFGVHHKRGVSFRYKLDLSDRDPEKHTRYLFDLTDVSLRDAAGELGLL